MTEPYNPQKKMYAQPISNDDYLSQIQKEMQTERLVFIIIVSFVLILIGMSMSLFK